MSSLRRLGILALLSTFLLIACSPKQQDEIVSPAGTATIPVAQSHPTVTRIPATMTSAAPAPAIPSAAPQTPLETLGRIAFLNNRYWISVMNPDGSNRIDLDDPDGDGGRHATTAFDECTLTWSPTGDEIAAAMDGYIYILPVDGSPGRRIFDSLGSDFCIDWSPDGSLLAFTSTRAGARHPSGQAYFLDVFVVRPDGTNLKMLTYSNHYCETVAWSPFGTYLASDCRLDGFSNIILTSSIQPAFEMLTVDNLSSRPAWSPDGSMLAFERGSSSSYNVSNIYVMSLDSRETRPLTSNDRSFEPIWSPDSRYVVFSYKPLDSDNELFLVEASSGETRQLTNNAVDDWHASWSPDGRYIVFSSGNDIAVLEVATGVTKILGSGNLPLWSPTTTSTPAVTVLQDCTGGWTRLTAGGQARVTGGPGDPPNRVRSEPRKGENLIGNLPPGTVVNIYEGPVCAEGLVFWKVGAAGIPGGFGWTAEGDGSEYWLEAYRP